MASKVFNVLYLDEYFRFNYGTIIAMGIFSIIYSYCVPKIKIGMTGKKKLLFGFAKLILPAIMISFSLKYQQELSWFGGMGMGYLPGIYPVLWCINGFFCFNINF